MATAVAHRLGRDEIIWAFGPDLEPVLEIDPGDTVTFETNDCFTGQITSEDDLVTGIDFERVNSATGPVAVRGAEPGDSLVAEILEVKPIEVGFACLIPGFGQLIEDVRSPVTRMFRVEDGWIEMNEHVRFPARPMVGVVGVATDGETLTNGLAGRHGGNLDDHLHGAGARIYFPVRQPGGMFAVGDMHASMGDGEICFTGVEIAGEVTIRFDLLKGKQATWPVTELAGSWVPHATADAYDEALKLCSEEAARLLVDEWGFSIEDAFIFLSVACDAGVAQACKPAPAGSARSPGSPSRSLTQRRLRSGNAEHARGLADAARDPQDDREQDRDARKGHQPADENLHIVTSFLREILVAGAGASQPVNPPLVRRKTAPTSHRSTGPRTGLHWV